MRRELLETLDRFNITGKQLSEISGMSKYQISRFRNNGELTLENFEKIVNSLPPDAYHYFWCRIGMSEMNSDQLCQLITMAASHLKATVYTQEKEPLKPDELLLSA